jgi:hypothetical protein
MERKYPEAFEVLRSAAGEKYRDHIGTKIAVDRAGLPPGFQRLKDDAFWGFMALPDVFLVFKSFELWTRDRAFLEAALPQGRFAYVEERVYPRPCLMADSFGMLADGRFVLCCLDYEGEMDLGGIDRTSVSDALLSEKRVAVRKDAMSEALCRRCRGNLFIFDTRLRPEETGQTVDKFGWGFWAREDDLFGRGGRWTDGKGWAYVFARVPARRIRLTFRSDFEDDVPLKLAVSEYDPASGDFSKPAASWPMRGRKGEPVDFEAPFAFEPGRFYRVEIASPSFVPEDYQHNGDTRRLGLAVFSLSLSA